MWFKAWPWAELPATRTSPVRRHSGGSAQWMVPKIACTTPCGLASPAHEPAALIGSVAHRPPRVAGTLWSGSRSSELSKDRTEGGADVKEVVKAHVETRARPLREVYPSAHGEVEDGQ